MPEISALGRLKQENSEFEASLGQNSEFLSSLSHTVRLDLKNPQTVTRKNSMIKFSKSWIIITIYIFSTNRIVLLINCK